MTPIEGWLGGLPGRAHALVRAGGRHPDVDDHHVGAQRRHRLQQPDRIREFGDHFAPRIAENPGDTGADERGVVDDHDSERSHPPTIAVAEPVSRTTGRSA